MTVVRHFSTPSRLGISDRKPLSNNLLVCGSRDLETPLSIVKEILFTYCDKWNYSEPFIGVHGKAPGADSLAGEVFAEMGIPVKKYPAKWDLYGKAAGPIRNQQMLDEMRPDLCIALLNKPLEESKGTFDMVKRCGEFGTTVVIVRVDKYVCNVDWEDGTGGCFPCGDLKQVDQLSLF